MINIITQFNILRDKWRTKRVLKLYRRIKEKGMSIEQARRLQYKNQHQQEDVSAQAYELFSQGKTPLQVTVSLTIRQSVATKLYREYWNLKRLHKLNLIY